MNDLDIDTTIPALGEARIPAPNRRQEKGPQELNCISDTEKVIIDVDLNNLNQMIKAGQPIP